MALIDRSSAALALAAALGGLLLSGCGESAANRPGGTGSGAAGAAGSTAGSAAGGQNSGGMASGGDASAGSSGSGSAQAGSAGAGGGGGQAPVGECEDLPAAGTWENVTPPGMSSKPAVNGTVGAAIIVDPFDARRVWLGTGGENDEIWRSDDCGATWTHVNTGPGSVGDGATYGGVGDGAQWSMQADPEEPGVLYAVSGYGAQSLWKTSDGGESWTDVLKGSDYETYADYRFVNNVSVDPGDHLHVVVSTHGACKDPYGPSCIAESKDGGTSWRLLRAPEGWVEGGGLVLVKDKLWIWCGTSLMVTTDAGETWLPDQLAGGGSCEAEYTIRSFVPAANGNYYLGSRDGLLRSADGIAWEHVGETHGFMVMVDHGSERLFVANQWQPTIWWANLDDDETLTELAAPAQISEGTDGGIPFLAYDDAHGILYASMFSGGVARLVVE